MAAVIDTVSCQGCRPVQLIETNGKIYQRRADGEIWEFIGGSLWKRISVREPLLAMAASNTELFKLRKNGDILRYGGYQMIWGVVKQAPREAIDFIVTDDRFYYILGDGCGTMTGISVADGFDSGNLSYTQLKLTWEESKADNRALQEKVDDLQHTKSMNAAANWQLKDDLSKAAASAIKKGKEVDEEKKKGAEMLNTIQSTAAQEAKIAARLEEEKQKRQAMLQRIAQTQADGARLATKFEKEKRGRYDMERALCTAEKNEAKLRDQVEQMREKNKELQDAKAELAAQLTKEKQNADKISKEAEEQGAAYQKALQTTLLALSDSQAEVAAVKDKMEDFVEVEGWDDDEDEDVVSHDADGADTDWAAS